jgi:hypothetical protein
MKPDGHDRHPPRRERSAGRGREWRCACGSLLARLTADGVELKCRRCKRLVVVRWSEREFRALDDLSRSPP